MSDQSNQTEQIALTPPELTQRISYDPSTEQETIEGLSEEDLEMIAGGSGELVPANPNALMLAKIRQARQIAKVGGLATAAVSIATSVGVGIYEGIKHH